MSYFILLLAWVQAMDLITKNFTISYILAKSSHDNNGQFSVLIRQKLCYQYNLFFFSERWHYNLFHGAFAALIRCLLKDLVWNQNFKNLFFQQFGHCFFVNYIKEIFSFSILSKYMITTAWRLFNVLNVKCQIQI